jgi:hypothetical protein
MRIHFLLALTLCAHVACTDTTTPTDEEPTAADLADLPGIDDHADLDVALAMEVPEDDAATFDNDEALATVDEPLEDDDIASPVIAAAKPLLKFGLAPRASDALRSAGIASWRIMQTIGHASASAGTHLQDGVVNGHPYCAATDISVSGLSQTQIANLLEKLAKVGFAAWYRHNGHDHWVGVNHIHAVYANLKMKSSLRSQVWSWLSNRNGLISNAIYTFHHWTAAARAVVRGKFDQSAHGTTNGGSTCFVGGLYCGGDKITGNHSWLYRCTGTGAPALVHKCANGCRINAGDDDSCK